MPNTTYFVQECPTCGRSLHVRVEYLGREVRCQHCRGQFVAWDEQGAPPMELPPPSSSGSLSGIHLLRRADELLEIVEQRRAKAV
jgi:DNA-directed RNA polymerase subunit RPC12/RpoP